jgi:antitoxin component YwqK of YwqJK toxin-antitoxin module
MKDSTQMETDTKPTQPRPRWLTVANRGYRVLLLAFALPSLCSLLGATLYYLHRPLTMLGILLVSLPFPLGCVLLMFPWRRLMANRVTKWLTLASALVVAHQLYGSWGMFKITQGAPGLFLLCSLVVGGACSSFLIDQHQQQRALRWPVLCVVLVLTSFIFGSGNPQWSRLIFIWQVYYSPWKQDPANLLTNRKGERQTYPKYTVWDQRGRKIREWTHPNDVLLRTEYYLDGQKRMERLYAADQFVTSWYPNGQVEYHYDAQTRQRRAYKRDGTPRNSDLIQYFSGSQRVAQVQQYSDGYQHGFNRVWHPPGDQLRREEPYLEGRRHGVCREWNHEGVLIREEHYQDGYRQGPRRKYRADGSLEWEEIYTKGDCPDGRKNY